MALEQGAMNAHALVETIEKSSEPVRRVLLLRAALRALVYVIRYNDWPPMERDWLRQTQAEAVLGCCRLLLGMQCELVFEMGSRTSSHLALLDLSRLYRRFVAESPIHSATGFGLQSIISAAREDVSETISAIQYASMSDKRMRSMDLDGAIETDQFLKPRFWLRAPLYKGDVEVISEMVEVSLSGSIFRDDPRFAFFASWYQGMLAGKPLDWELQRRIATEIPPEIWEAGIDAVAPEIARIEAEWESGREAQEPRSPEYEPNSVAHLFDYPLSVSGNLTVAANSISVGFEQFRAETGLNETPEFLQPLEAMSANMERIAAIVGEQVRSSMTEQALREEIGRLMAKVAHLEAELAKAKTDLDLKSKPWFGKAAILCSAAAGLGTAVWTLSGDEIGAKKRMETLAEYWEVGKGLFNTAPVEGPAPKPQLPPATDV